MGLTGCADTKTFQCQKIFRVANEVANETKSLTGDRGREINKQSWLMAADKIESGADKMKNLEVNDPELQKFKESYARVYQDYADATREIIRVLDTRDKNAARITRDKVRKAGQLEQETGDAFDAYCKKQ